MSSTNCPAPPAAPAPPACGLVEDITETDNLKADLDNLTGDTFSVDANPSQAEVDDLIAQGVLPEDATPDEVRIYSGTGCDSTTPATAVLTKKQQGEFLNRCAAKKRAMGKGANFFTPMMREDSINHPHAKEHTATWVSQGHDVQDASFCSYTLNEFGIHNVGNFDLAIAKFSKQVYGTSFLSEKDYLTTEQLLEGVGTCEAGTEIGEFDLWDETTCPHFSAYHQEKDPWGSRKIWATKTHTFPATGGWVMDIILRGDVKDKFGKFQEFEALLDKWIADLPGHYPIAKTHMFSTKDGKYIALGGGKEDKLLTTIRKNVSAQSGIGILPSGEMDMLKMLQEHNVQLTAQIDKQGRLLTTQDKLIKDGEAVGRMAMTMRNQHIEEVNELENLNAELRGLVSAGLARIEDLKGNNQVAISMGKKIENLKKEIVNRDIKIANIKASDDLLKSMPKRAQRLWMVQLTPMLEHWGKKTNWSAEKCAVKNASSVALWAREEYQVSKQQVRKTSVVRVKKKICQSNCLMCEKSFPTKSLTLVNGDLLCKRCE